MKNALTTFLFETDDRLGPLVLRLGLAIVIWPHGAQKLIGWFGGSGFSGTMEMFTQNLNIPAPLAVVAILTEFFGPVLLVLGLLTRVAALGIGIQMTVAALLVHLPHGFFMNWRQNKEGEGFEYHLLVLTIALGLLVQGAGKAAIDRYLARRLNQP